MEQENLSNLSSTEESSPESPNCPINRVTEDEEGDGDLISRPMNETEVSSGVGIIGSSIDLNNIVKEKRSENEDILSNDISDRSSFRKDSYDIIDSVERSPLSRVNTTAADQCSKVLREHSHSFATTKTEKIDLNDRIDDLSPVPTAITGSISSSYCSSNGPVFPARHNKEIESTKNSEESRQEKDEPVVVNSIDNAAKKVLLSYIDTPNNLTRIKQTSLKDPNPQLMNHHHQMISQNQIKIGTVSESTSVHDIKRENLAKEGSSTKNETEQESLAPLNASFFNCQYQTPSWIDDPLIGVPPCAMENKNTHRKTGADMRILTAYMRSLNEMRLPEAIPPTELDKYLSSFFLVVRKADGSEYEPCSLRAMLASIERYLRFKNYPLSLTRDAAFSNMRNGLKLKQQTLRSIGKGQKSSNDASPSSLAREGKIAHLFKSQEMGPYTPSSVVFTLCFYFCMYLKIRKSTENKKLLWGDIILCKDESGREFLTFSSQMLMKTQGTKGNTRQRSYRVWADPSCPEKDPVTIYKFYAQKRPVSMNTNFAPFYLGVNVLYPTQGQLWYRPAAMGINKLNEMVRQIRDITGIRSAADYQNGSKPEKLSSEFEKSRQDGESPTDDHLYRQDLDNEIKMETVDDIDADEDDSSPSTAIDFSFSHEQPLNLNNSTSSESAPPPAHPTLTALGNMAQAIYSDGDSDDSFSHQSFPSKVNGTVEGKMDREMDQEIDLTKTSGSDSPLNCSVKSRNSLLSGGGHSMNASKFL